MVLTEWEEFRALTAEAFNRHMKRSFVIDGRRIFDESLRGSVDTYRGIGLGARRPAVGVTGG